MEGFHEGKVFGREGEGDVAGGEAAAGEASAGGFGELVGDFLRGCVFEFERDGWGMEGEVFVERVDTGEEAGLYFGVGGRVGGGLEGELGGGEGVELFLGGGSRLMKSSLPKSRRRGERDGEVGGGGLGEEEGEGEEESKREVRMGGLR